MVLANDSVVVLQGDTGAAAVYDRTARLYQQPEFIERLNAYLVEVDFVEGGAYVLVWRSSGDTLEIAGPPIVSPSGRQFVVTSMDLEAEFNPTVVEVYRVNEDEIERTYELAPEEWGPSDASWIGEDTIEFRRNVLMEDFSYEQSPAWLVQQDGAWSVVWQRKEGSGV